MQPDEIDMATVSRYHSIRRGQYPWINANIVGPAKTRSKIKTPSQIRRVCAGILVNRGSMAPPQ